MRAPPGLVPDPAAQRRLGAVAAGHREPDLVVSGGRVLNVFTGALEQVDVVVAEGRIARLGREDRSATGVARLDADGAVLVPGLVEPHAHPDLIYGPSAMAGAAASFGTTTLCTDLLTMALLLDDDALVRLAAAVEDGPARVTWALRPSAEGIAAAEERLSAARCARLMRRIPSIMAIGEMTAWHDLVRDDDRLAAVVASARRAGMRVNGHLPGASPASLGRAVVAGVTDDHEATTADEVRDRLRLGLWVMLRHSSLRPDAPRMVGALADPALRRDRVMLTTDGPVAADAAVGHLDAVVRAVVESGVPPVEAVRMATLNPATYLGIDQHVGAIAPGRSADLVMVPSLRDFTPSLVLARGRVVDPLAPTARYPHLPGPPMRGARLDPEALRAAAIAGPAIRLDGVITHVDTGGPGETYAAFVARDGSWLVAATLVGLRTTALASSYTGTGDVLLLGTDVAAAVQCYAEVVRCGGAIVTPGRRLPLPVMGLLSELPMAGVAAAVRELAAQVDGPPVPLEFLLLFLTLGALPGPRLTPAGVLDVRSRRILSPATPLTRE